jgi:hypothetical protein
VIGYRGQSMACRQPTSAPAGHPHLRDAFLAGYGPLTNLDWAVIEHCRHLNTLARIARAHGLHIADATVVPAEVITDIVAARADDG